jgi:hypothetical protein
MPGANGIRFLALVAPAVFAAGVFSYPDYPFHPQLTRRTGGEDRRRYQSDDRRLENERHQTGNRPAPNNL